MNETEVDKSSPEEVPTSEVVEVPSQEEVVNPSSKAEGKTSTSSKSKGKTTKKGSAPKRKGQMSISDFKGVHVVKSKQKDATPTSTRNNMINSTSAKNTKRSTSDTNKESSKTKSKSDEKPEEPEVPLEQLIPKKHAAFSELESNRYKILKVEKTKRHPSLKNLQSLNWTPNVPLLSDDFREFDTTAHTAWQNTISMKQIPYASYILKIMSFINKFPQCFDKVLGNITFKDLWEGLSADNDIDALPEMQERKDKINLLLHSLLRMLFWDGSDKTTFTPAEMSKFKNMKQPYGKMVGRLWSSEEEWGSPKEWRTEYSVDTTNKESEEKKESMIVDSSLPEVLTDMNNFLPLHTPINKDNHPFYALPRADIDANGVFTMPNYKDRIILLHYLVNTNIAFSPVIHKEVNDLPTVKHDQMFTYVVPNFFLEGINQTLEDFTDLCESILIYINSKRNVKQMKYKAQMPTVDKIRGVLNAVGKDETERRQTVILSMFKKWCVLLDSTIPNNSLFSPYEGDVAILRQQEFFVGRVDRIGDFFIPRMHTYESDNNVTNLYTDLLSLLDLFERYAKGTINDYEIFNEFEGKINTDFTLLYCDTPQNIKSMINNEFITEENVWYEVSNDSKSLKVFIDKLNDVLSNQGELELATLVKEEEYKHTKASLTNLKYYLEKLHPVIATYEKVKKSYLKGDSATDISTRTSRLKRPRVNYKLQSENTFDSDDELGDSYHQGQGSKTGSTSDDDFTYDDKEMEDTPEGAAEFLEPSDEYTEKPVNSRAMRSRLRMERK
ncbi:hypothetical protein DAKH74_017630 [Maudiozyma humilis]|uniref:WHIM1 domain-containing protein n=1 Tax=Maudiozyma humilis TaxID=51915 RepID=A0AAV5RWN8_MAUHU|nr:hypothetical protein DAKH74_017630 [Kazachstania humilis]